MRALVNSGERDDSVFFAPRWFPWSHTSRRVPADLTSHRFGLPSPVGSGDLAIDLSRRNPASFLKAVDTQRVPGKKRLAATYPLRGVDEASVVNVHFVTHHAP